MVLNSAAGLKQPNDHAPVFLSSTYSSPSAPLPPPDSIAVHGTTPVVTIIRSEDIQGIRESDSIRTAADPPPRPYVSLTRKFPDLHKTSSLLEQLAAKRAAEKLAAERAAEEIAALRSAAAATPAPSSDLS